MAKVAQISTRLSNETVLELWKNAIKSGGWLRWRQMETSGGTTDDWKLQASKNELNQELIEFQRKKYIPGTSIGGHANSENAVGRTLLWNDDEDFPGKIPTQCIYIRFLAKF